MTLLSALLEIDGISIGVGVAAGAIIAGIAVYMTVGKKKSEAVQSAESDAAKIRDEAKRKLEDAERQAKDRIRAAENEAREAASKAKDEIQKTVDKDRNEVKDLEKRLAKREEQIADKFEMLDKKHETLEQRQKEIEALRAKAEKSQLDIAKLVEDEKRKLLELSRLSEADAKRELLDVLDRELVNEKAARIEKVERLIAEHADQKAKWVVSQAIVRLASEHTGETTTTSITIPKDDIKGKVIGREGRNIKAFEKTTGCDLIVDDTPGVVVVSCFDSVRREVGRRTLERLIEDGRIHPARIEEVFAICEKDVDKEVLEAGKRIQFDADCHNIDPRAQKLLGRLKFRSSYGQNVYKHTVEVAYLCGMMASELGLDAKLARRCGLMHDIGKAIDHEQEGGHPFVGGEFLKKIKELPEVIEAAAGHHDNVLNHKYIYTSLAAAADAISASRPGARRESMERYVQRLTSLEAVATGMTGVQAAFAIQAGRELRVFVDHTTVTDESAASIARDIAKRIEEELTYPGEIRVTLLRETRCVEYAR
jgi:ribonuclease Y